MNVKKENGNLKCFICDGEEIRKVQYKVLARNEEEAEQKMREGQCLIEHKGDTERKLGKITEQF